MKRAKLFLVGLLVALPLFGWAAIAQAQSFQSGTNLTLPANQTLNSSLFASGRTIDIAGTVNGDVFCAGLNVTINGTVNGDVVCAGQTVTIAGTVRGDVRVAAQNASIGGAIGGNLTAAAQSFTLQSNGRVAGDATVASQDATFNGGIGRDVASSSATVIINGQVERNVQTNVGQLTLGNNARVAGSLTYASTDNIVQAPSAVVGGKITHTSPSTANHTQAGSLGAFAWASAIYLFFALLLLALILVLLVPRLFHSSTDYALQHLGRTVLVGFLASIIAPIALTALYITVIGIPLAILASLVWLVIVIMAWPFAAYLTARLLLRHSQNAIQLMLLGAAGLLVVGSVPFLGVLVWFVALWFGLGIIILRLSHLPRPRYDMATTTTSGGQADIQSSGHKRLKVD